MRDLDCQSGLELWDRWNGAGCRWEWLGVQLGRADGRWELVLNVRRIVRWSVVSELADAASGMLGAGRELDDEAAGLLDEDGVGRFRFKGGSVGAADNRSCFGSMLGSGITTDAGGSV
jgi:hypothetical protein